MRQSVYHSQDIQAWEQRWFDRQNSAYGLMQQAAWCISQHLLKTFNHTTPSINKIAVCCGAGNNAGDGYLVAKYLAQAGYYIDIYTAVRGNSPSLAKAFEEAQSLDGDASYHLQIHSGFEFKHDYEVYIDALFGIGLNRELDCDWQQVIHQINSRTGIKISLDVPSGLHADTGQTLPCAIKADTTYSILALKAGLFTGKGKEYAGQIETIPLIPADYELTPLAQLSPNWINLPQRQAFGHKGSYGHVLVVGGHADMGGAVIMAAEAAFASGAGKVSVVCDAKHHTAVLSRSPNIMVRDLNEMDENAIELLLGQVDAVCLGMGLGRDAWAEKVYLLWMQFLIKTPVTVVLDADALWFLALHAQKLPENFILTPHPGEASTLLHTHVKDIESDRIRAIYALQTQYAGQWVLKGAGTLILEQIDAQGEFRSQTHVPWICTVGNAGMATGGMGDVLAGLIASLKAQFKHQIALHQMVTLHALAGDDLARTGMRGLQAHHMNQAIYRVVNLATSECSI